MAEEEEGMDFAAQFTTQFGRNEAATEDRLRAERKAGRTAKQRAARKEPKKQINIRASTRTHALVAVITAHLEQTTTDVIEMALVTLAEKLGVKE